MKRFSHIFFVFVVLAGMLSSCQDEISKAVVIGGTSFRDHQISSRIEVVPSPDEDPETKSSFAGNESRINTWTLVQLDEEQQEVVKVYNWTRRNSEESPNISNIEVQFNKEYRWYAVANAGVPSSVVPGAARSVVEAMVLTCVPKDSTTTATTFPMAWKSASTTSYTKADLSGDNPATLQVNFDRLVSKWSVTLDKSGLSQYGFTASSLQMKGTGVVTPFASSRASSTLTVTDQATAADISSLNGGNAVVFYTLENLSGSGSAVLKETGGNSYQKKQSNIKAGIYPSYVEVSGNISLQDGSGLVVPGVYRFYLGTDNTQDFNVLRNRRSTITLAPTDEWVTNAIKETKHDDDWTQTTPIWKVEAGDFDDTRSVVWEHAADPGYVQLPTDGTAIAEGIIASPSGLLRKFKLSNHLYEAGTPVARVYLDAGMTQEVTPSSAGTWVNVDAASQLYFCAPAGHSALEGIATVATLDGRKTSDIEVRVGRRLSEVKLHLASDGRTNQYQCNANVADYSTLLNAYNNNTALWQYTKDHKDTLFLFCNYGGPGDIYSRMVTYFVTAHYSDGTETNITELLTTDNFSFAVEGLAASWRSDLSSDQRYGINVYPSNRYLIFTANGYQSSALGSLYNNRFVTVSYTDEGVTKSGTARLSCINSWAPYLYVSETPVSSQRTIRMTGLNFDNHIPNIDGEFVLPNRSTVEHIRSGIDVKSPIIDGYSFHLCDFTAQSSFTLSKSGIISLDKTATGYTLSAVSPGTTNLTVTYDEPATFILLPGHNNATIGGWLQDATAARNQYALDGQPVYNDKLTTMSTTIRLRVRELQSMLVNNVERYNLNIMDVLSNLSENQTSSNRSGTIDFKAAFINESAREDIEDDPTVRFNDKEPRYSGSTLITSSLGYAISDLVNKSVKISPAPGYYALFTIRSMSYDSERHKIDYTWDVRRLSESGYNSSSQTEYTAGDYLLKGTYSYGDVTSTAYFGLMCDLHEPVSVTVKPATTSMYLYERREISYAADLQYRYKPTNTVYSHLTDVTSTQYLRSLLGTYSYWELAWSPSSGDSYSFPTYTPSTSDQNVMTVKPQTTPGTIDVTGTFSIGSSSVSGTAVINVVDPGNVTALEIVIPDGYPGPNELVPTGGLFEDGEGTRLQAFATFSNGQRLNVTNSADWLWGYNTGAYLEGFFESTTTRQPSAYEKYHVGSRSRLAGFVIAGGSGYGNAYTFYSEFTDNGGNKVTASITLRNQSGGYSEIAQLRTRTIGGTFSTSPISVQVGESFEVAFYYRAYNGSWYLVNPDNVTITNSNLIALSSDDGSSRVYVGSAAGQVTMKFTEGSLESNTVTINITSGPQPQTTYRFYVGDSYGNGGNGSYSTSIYYGEQTGFYAWMQPQDGGMDVGDPIDVSGDCSWTLSPSGSGHGSVSSIGLYTAEASGDSQDVVEVHATYTGGAYSPINSSDYGTVTVTAAVGPLPTYKYRLVIEASPASPIVAGSSYTLRAIAERKVSTDGGSTWSDWSNVANVTSDVNFARASGIDAATVNNSAKTVTSDVEGTAVITGSYNGSMSYTFESVVNAEVEWTPYYVLVIGADELNPTTGDAVNLSATLYKKEGLTLTLVNTVTSQTTFSSSSATIDNGNKTAVRSTPGSATITGSYTGVTVSEIHDATVTWAASINPDYEYKVVTTASPTRIEKDNASSTTTLTAKLYRRDTRMFDPQWVEVGDVTNAGFSQSGEGGLTQVSGNVYKGTRTGTVKVGSTYNNDSMYIVARDTASVAVYELDHIGITHFNRTSELSSINITDFDSALMKFRNGVDFKVRAYYSDNVIEDITSSSNLMVWADGEGGYMSLTEKVGYRTIKATSCPSNSGEFSGTINAKYYTNVATNDAEETSITFNVINYAVPVLSAEIISDQYNSQGLDNEQYRGFAINIEVVFKELITGFPIVDYIDPNEGNITTTNYSKSTEVHLEPSWSLSGNVWSATSTNSSQTTTGHLEKINNVTYDIMNAFARLNGFVGGGASITGTIHPYDKSTYSFEISSSITVNGNTGEVGGTVSIPSFYDF